MSILDIIGPVMIGPSSSHTAGAVRLGLLAASILGAKPVKAEIYLHGSFAETYKGHGTDMALLAGLMGWLPDDERIPQADSYAEKNGLEYSYHKIDLGNKAHPNTVLFKLTAENGARCDIVGSSVGGGQVQVTEIDGFPVELTGRLPAIFDSAYRYKRCYCSGYQYIGKCRCEYRYDALVPQRQGRYGIYGY